MEGKPRLLELSQCPNPGTKANVLILSGLPWFISEARVAQYLSEVYADARPVTTRLYDDPVNGASRGHCFVEYAVFPARSSAAASSASPSPPPSGGSMSIAEGLEEVKRAVELAPLEQAAVTATPVFLTSSRWDRGGRLPDLPWDAALPRRGQRVGYGEDGYAVRCGPALGLANTVTAAGASRMRALRKRLRAGAARRGRSSDGSSSSSGGSLSGSASDSAGEGDA